jgi:hypothetical protein
VPFRSILIGVQSSIVLIVFGGALLLLHATHTLPDDSAVVMGICRQGSSSRRSAHSQAEWSSQVLSLP